MTHYGFDEITDEEYQAAFKAHSLGSLAKAADKDVGADPVV